MRLSTLKGFHEGLVLIEQAVADAILVETGDELSVYPGRPRGGDIELPAIYNVIKPSTMEPIDTVVDIDHFTIHACIAVRYTDVEDELADLLGYADIFRSVVDKTLKDNTGPLGGTRVRRLGLAADEDAFGEVLSRIIEFPIRAELEAANPPVF